MTHKLDPDCIVTDVERIIICNYFYVGQYLPQHEEVWKEFPRYQNRLKDFPIIHEDIFTNDLGLPVSKPVVDWKPPQELPSKPMLGKSCRLKLLALEHTLDLWKAFSHDKEEKMWTYMPYGPFHDLTMFETWLQSLTGHQDRITYAVIDLQTGKAVGLVGFMYINPAAGTIAIGHVNISPLIQDSAIVSEAIILMARKAFELGYRRLEWFCHTLHSQSVSAAKRLGFSYEGVFRNYRVAKGHNADIAWFSIIDEEWPELDEVFTKWLSLTRDNHHQSLTELMDELKSHRN